MKRTGSLLRRRYVSLWAEVERANENPEAKKTVNEAMPRRLCLWETGLLRKSGVNKVSFCSVLLRLHMLLS